MRLDRLGDVHLTYCTNIHAGESWRDVCSSLDAHVPEVKRRVSPDRPMGVGLRLSGEAAAAARNPENLRGFQDQLQRLGAYVFTINAFPYGPFHGVRVKEQVYLPDWRSSARVAFTSDAAAVLATILPEGQEGSISTVPGSFKANAGEPGAQAAMTQNLLRAVAELVQIERECGKTIALALEPEPCCFLETVDETIAYFESALLSRDALGALAAMTKVSAASAERQLRRHLGVCYDACHGSVEFEQPVGAMTRLRASGLNVAKLQLSVAMRIPQMRADLASELEPYNDGVYLHQTVVQHEGKLTRYIDLPDALADFKGGHAQGEWRIHCHVPLFLSDMGAIGSTQGDLLDVLRAMRDTPLSRHLEVETYTWDVLPSALRTGSKSADIAREMSFCLQELTP
jgi:hypothetical protein